MAVGVLEVGVVEREVERLGAAVGALDDAFAPVDGLAAGGAGHQRDARIAVAVRAQRLVDQRLAAQVIVGEIHVHHQVAARRDAVPCGRGTFTRSIAWIAGSVAGTPALRAIATAAAALAMLKRARHRQLERSQLLAVRGQEEAHAIVRIGARRHEQVAGAAAAVRAGRVIRAVCRPCRRGRRTAPPARRPYI